MLKRESTLLLERIAGATLDMEAAIQMASSAPLIAGDEAPANAYQFALDQNRVVRFDAQRMIALIDADSEALRTVYALSLAAVDCIRIAASLDDSSRAKFLAEAEGSLAKMQATIEALFPNETLAG